MGAYFTIYAQWLSMDVRPGGECLRGVSSGLKPCTEPSKRFSLAEGGETARCLPCDPDTIVSHRPQAAHGFQGVP